VVFLVVVVVFLAVVVGVVLLWPAALTKAVLRQTVATRKRIRARKEYRIVASKYHGAIPFQMGKPGVIGIKTYNPTCGLAWAALYGKETPPKADIPHATM
jgi:hypothetical protein